MTKNLTVSWKSHYPTPICEKYFFEQVSKVYLCLLVAVNSFLAHRLETPVVKKNRRACSSEIWEINPRAIKILFCGSGLNVFHLYEVTIHKKKHIMSRHIFSYSTPYWGTEKVCAVDLFEAETLCLFTPITPRLVGQRKAFDRK